MGNTQITVEEWEKKYALPKLSLVQKEMKFMPSGLTRFSKQLYIAKHHTNQTNPSYPKYVEGKNDPMSLVLFLNIMKHHNYKYIFNNDCNIKTFVYPLHHIKFDMTDLASFPIGRHLTYQVAPKEFNVTNCDGTQLIKDMSIEVPFAFGEFLKSRMESDPYISSINFYVINNVLNVQIDYGIL